MKKITVGFLIDKTVIGGVETIFYELCKELFKTNKYNIVFFTNCLKNQKIADLFKKNNSEIVNTFLDFGEKPKSFFKKLIYKNKRHKLKIKSDKVLKNFFQNKDIDFFVDFHNGGVLTNKRNQKLLKKNNKPLVMWMHGSINFFRDTFLVDGSLKKLDIFNKIVCISNTIILELVKEFPEIENKLFKFYNFLNMENVEKLSLDLSDLNSKEKDLLKEKYFTCVSRINDDKEVETVVQAFILFCEKTGNLNNWKLILVGSGNLENILKERYKNYSNIIFLGNKNNPYPFIKNSKASILSSINEGAPMVLIESMMLKTIAISSDCPTAPAELLEYGKCGVLFEPKNEVALAEIFEKIYFGKIKKEDFIDNINSSIHRFDSNFAAKNFESLLESLPKK